MKGSLYVNLLFILFVKSYIIIRYSYWSLAIITTNECLNVYFFSYGICLCTVYIFFFRIKILDLI